MPRQSNGFRQLPHFQAHTSMLKSGLGTFEHCCTTLCVNSELNLWEFRDPSCVPMRPVPMPSGSEHGQ